MKQIVSLIFSFTMFCVIFYEIYSGKTIASDEASRCKRAEEPRQFWLSILFQLFLAISFFGLGMLITA